VLARSDPERAVVVLAAAAALREELGTPIPPAEAPDREAAMAHLARRVTSSTYPTAWARGRELELDAAVDLAVEGIDAVSGMTGASSGQRTTGEPLLTPRELAVLELLVEGHTNREIAAALYISASTAGVHVSNILRKLGAKRRVDAAGIAHKMGLLPER
jgi:DNA-binding NarL/FixJ family response regulator